VGGDTYRAIYSVRLPGIVYVLHVFQKKSTRRSRVPRRDMDLIGQRLKQAERDHAQRRE